ncbi:MAG TPA: response regulator [Fimbriimonadaceae bacterium]|nr:response regulator [Fimbriimonadaceae bacterium]
MEPSERVNILLVDDQRGKLLSYSAILESLDENLILATSGREALEQLLKHDIAVILVDVCMPEQDGFELAEMIRSHHRFKKTAIIFVSAVHMTDLDRIKGYATGAVDFVSVPIVPDILRARVAVFVELFRKTRQLERLNAELEERVLERTSQLSQTEEALREANQRKDVFLAMLAHELRNPLAPIRSSLDGLQEVASEFPSSGTWLRVMDRQLDHLTRLIDDLMDLSRINQGKLELRRARTKLAEVVMGGVETAQPAIDAGKQELRTTLPRQPVLVDVDPARISQVISNLLLNASKFAEAGGVITFEASVEENRVKFVVRDDGAGIATEELPHVFAPFYQAQDLRDGRKDGLGIGLTLVRVIVEMHGGDVHVASDGPGTGAEFTVELPCVVSAKARLTKQPRREHVCEAKRVLVVDDNRDAAAMLALLFERKGNSVQVANDGQSALKVADSMRPDLIILDLGMPGMDGLAVAREIRRRPWAGATVIVAMTGWGQLEDRRQSQEAGFDRHFVKPVRFAELEQLLAQAGR